MKTGSKVLVLAFAVLFGGALAGCSNACDTLKTQCAKCTDSITMADCNAVVTANVSDRCTEGENAFAMSCPQ